MHFLEDAAAYAALRCPMHTHFQPLLDFLVGTGARYGEAAGLPPEVAARALDLLPAHQATARLDLVRPPMRWLVEVAADLDGRLVGSAYRGFACFDGVQVEAAAARTLAERVDQAWSATKRSPAALPAATAEGWSGWEADWPLWTGNGADLLEQPLPAGVAVVGLIWN